LRSILKPLDAAGSGVTGAPVTETTACIGTSPRLVILIGLLSMSAPL